MDRLPACPGTLRKSRSFIGETGKSIRRILGSCNRETDSRNLVLRSGVNTSLAGEPSPKRLLRTGFTSARLSGFIAARLFFSIADARVRTVRLISFATRYGARHVRRTDRVSRAVPATEKLHLRVN